MRGRSAPSARTVAHSYPRPCDDEVDSTQRGPMARSSALRRYLGALLVLALVLGMVPLFLSGRALADGYYPPSCWHTALSKTDWGPNCTCGENGSAFVRDANYVTGIQREINKLQGYYPGWVSAGTQDGIFGSQTAAAVWAFQAYYGYRDYDGIVGRRTWELLRARLVYRGENGLCSMYSVGASTNQYWRYYPYGYWEIVRKSGSGWVQFNTAGPD
jgi:hypothetical protein